VSGLWTILIGNALPAAGLAIIAFLVSRIVRRPALSHALWLLVLIKLVTPPVLPYAIGVSGQTAATLGMQAEPVRASSTAVSASAQQASLAEQLFPASETSGPTIGPSHSTARPQWGDGGEATPHKASGPLALDVRHRWSRWGIFAAAIVWLAGTVVLSVMSARQVIVLRRWFSASVPIDSSSQEHVAELASRLDRIRAPQVRLLDGLVSPLVWGVGRWATIIFPKTLWDELPDESRDALLLHELAHVRRHDQWVRVLEATVCCLYWWHPCVWWARRELAAAEEECCDALVVRQAGHHSFTYAEAILTTLDYLAGEKLSPRVITTGLDTMPVLKRRLRQIMERSTSPSLPMSVRCVLVLVAAVTLPLQPLLQVIPNRQAAATTVGPDDVARVSPETMAVIIDNATAEAIDSAQSDPLPDAPHGWWSPRARTAPAITAGAGQFVIERQGDRLGLIDRHQQVRHDLSASGITCVAWTPDGERFVAGTDRGTIQLWDAATGTPVSLLGQSDDVITSLDVDPNGARVVTGSVTGSRSGSVIVWELSSGTAIHTWTDDGASINCVRFVANDRIAVSHGHWSRPDSTAVTLLGADGLKPLERIPTPHVIAAISTDPRGLLLADYTGRLLVWDDDTRSLTARGRMDRQRIDAANFSPSGVLTSHL